MNNPDVCCARATGVMRVCTALVGLLWSSAILIGADTHYVATNALSVSPYTSWADAASNIEWAVGQAAASDTVLVSNGTYNLTNQITITTGIEVKGISRDDTTVDGNNAVRCFIITNCNNTNNAVLDSLTITKGKTSTVGGGVASYFSNLLMTNCIVKNCNATGGGGAMYLSAEDSTAYTNTIKNSTFFNNYCGATIWAGALYIKNTPKTMIDNCNLYCNTGGYGGAIGVQSSGIIMNSTIVSNVAGARGGAMYVYDYTTVSNSVIAYNTCLTGIAGGICCRSTGGAYPLRIINCLISGNTASTGGGISFYSGMGILENCTIAGNLANTRGGGIDRDDTGSPASSGSVTNCIIYYNASNSSNDVNTSASTYFYSCSSGLVHGANGNITNAPGFKEVGSGAGTNNYVAGNYRLNADSSCINAGVNKSWMTNAIDLDGNRRIRYGTVDMGAYEFILSGSIYGFR